MSRAADSQLREAINRCTKKYLDGGYSYKRNQANFERRKPYVDTFLQTVTDFPDPLESHIDGLNVAIKHLKGANALPDIKSNSLGRLITDLDKAVAHAKPVHATESDRWRYAMVVSSAPVATAATAAAEAKEAEAKGDDEDYTDARVAAFKAKNFYQRLRVDNKAETRAIKTAYMKLARSFHPDKHAGADSKDNATELFKLVCQAYETLSDAEKRTAYDEALALGDFEEVAGFYDEGYVPNPEAFNEFDAVVYAAVAQLKKKVEEHPVETMFVLGAAAMAAVAGFAMAMAGEGSDQERRQHRGWF